MWQVIHDRLSTREKILIRNADTTGKYDLCGLDETLDHLLFLCPLAVFVWSVLSKVVAWPDCPHCLVDLLSLSKQDECANFEMVWVGDYGLCGPSAAS
jgi:hypothetical protein